MYDNGKFTFLNRTSFIKLKHFPLNKIKVYLILLCFTNSVTVCVLYFARLLQYFTANISVIWIISASHHK